ncbi:INO80 complex, subunit Ies4 [Coniochaeta sp. 2T2.1]|nr:INO80 complex, subunit Ies4 [Coniochaeta sp. 2T2.1]
MASGSKTATMTKDRRKSANNGTKSTPIRSSTTPEKTAATSRIVTLKVTPPKLRAIVAPETLKKEDTPAKEDVKESPATSTTIPAPENASDSNPATPAASGTPAPQPMGPPVEGPKKKGVKRSAAAANGEPKARGRPGPKKKQRLYVVHCKPAPLPLPSHSPLICILTPSPSDDGTLVEGGKANGAGAAHKLGPKANQGAINAGLRALDRSGKPCRKWTKGGFTLKSFTGTVWDVSRWTAPPKPKPEGASTEDSATVSAEGDSSKENNNKENGNGGVEKMNTPNGSNHGGGGDVEMRSAPASVGAANSPAPGPFAIAAA